MEEKLIGLDEAMMEVGAKASHFRKLAKEYGLVAYKKPMNRKHIYFRAGEIQKLKEKLEKVTAVR